MPVEEPQQPVMHSITDSLTYNPPAFSSVVEQIPSISQNVVDNNLDTGNVGESQIPELDLDAMLFAFGTSFTQEIFFVSLSFFILTRMTYHCSSM